VRAAKRFYGWPEDAQFLVPDGWDAALPEFPADAKGLATRDSSGKVLNALARSVPWLVGGSADLGPAFGADGAAGHPRVHA
jgi:transketolase